MMDFTFFGKACVFCNTFLCTYVFEGSDGEDSIVMVWVRIANGMFSTVYVRCEIGRVLIPCDRPSR